MPRAATSATVRSQLCFVYFNTVATDIMQTVFSASTSGSQYSDRTRLTRVRLQTAERRTR